MTVITKTGKAITVNAAATEWIDFAGRKHTTLVWRGHVYTGRRDMSTGSFEFYY